MRFESQFLRPVTEARARSPGAAEALRQRPDIAIRVQRPMKKHQPAPALKKTVELSAFVRTPGRIVMVKGDHLGPLPLIGVWPLIGGFDGYPVGDGEQFGPTLSPQRIIVEARCAVPFVLRRSTENDAQRQSSRGEGT